MHIESVRIQNLRSFKDVTVKLNNYSCLVGPNGAGKSTVLCALNIFFRETAHSSTDLTQLTEEDFHQKQTDSPITITVTFTSLNAEAQEDFAHYHRQGKLIVSAEATFNPETKRAEVRQFGQRLGMNEFRPYFELEGKDAKAPELIASYAALREQFPDLPQVKVKAAMSDALKTYEAEHPDACSLIASEDQFYGVSKGSNRLAKYIQWVYVPAVKDAAAEQMEARNTALGKLLARTVRSKVDFKDTLQQLREETRQKYQLLLDERQPALAEISGALQAKLTEWAHPEATLKIEWQQDIDKSVNVIEPLASIIAGEGMFEGSLARFGHGLQRSYLLALLHELASSEDENAPSLILGCEEPELYQHPPQARHLAGVMQALSETNSQIIVTTHSPYFVSGDGFENVRMVRKDNANKQSYITSLSYDELAQNYVALQKDAKPKPSGTLAKINQALQPSLNEMFFTSRLILVEGLEDVAYITAYLHLADKWNEYRRLGCHIVPVNGKSEILQPLLIAKRLGIATFVVFDSDGDKENKSGSRTKHEKDNTALLAALEIDAPPFLADTLWTPNAVMWKSDIGAIVKEEIGADWTAFQQTADKHYDHIENLRKNSLHIAESLSLAWGAGKRSASLLRLCESIIASNEQQVQEAQTEAA